LRKRRRTHQSIRNGDTYYRYGGRTMHNLIELENIINELKQNNSNWLDLMSKNRKLTRKCGYSRHRKGIIEKGNFVLVLDEALTEINQTHQRKVNLLRKKVQSF
jgi:CRISPR/Cas system CSM-associated protein Csm2 small subunit